MQVGKPYSASDWSYSGVTPRSIRNKHNCQICGEPFSRRWNMERHKERRHPSDFRSLPSAFQDTNYRVSKYSTFKSHSPNYHNAYSNFHNSSYTFHRSPFLEDSSMHEQTNVLRTVNDPLDSWLQNLRSGLKSRD
jgi:arginyl-tRNA--protein-N-Asp/Glu arginylyltransferase